MNRNQTWNPDQYARNARFVAELGLPVVDLLNPQPGERILGIKNEELRIKNFGTTNYD